MIPLLTMLSITGVASASAVAASACLPALSARVALRIALRSCEVSASLRARCAVDCLAAFSADFVFAKRRLLRDDWDPLGPPKEPHILRIRGALVNAAADAGESRIIISFPHGTSARPAEPVQSLSGLRTHRGQL